MQDTCTFNFLHKAHNCETIFFFKEIITSLKFSSAISHIPNISHMFIIIFIKILNRIHVQLPFYKFSFTIKATQLPSSPLFYKCTCLLLYRQPPTYFSSISVFRLRAHTHTHNDMIICFLWNEYKSLLATENLDGCKYFCHYKFVHIIYMKAFFSPCIVKAVGKRFQYGVLLKRWQFHVLCWKESHEAKHSLKDNCVKTI